MMWPLNRILQSITPKFQSTWVILWVRSLFCSRNETYSGFPLFLQELWTPAPLRVRKRAFLQLQSAERGPAASFKPLAFNTAAAFLPVTKAETRPPLSHSSLSVYPHVSEDTVTDPRWPLSVRELGALHDSAELTLFLQVTKLSSLMVKS